MKTDGETWKETQPSPHTRAHGSGMGGEPELIPIPAASLGLQVPRPAPRRLFLPLGRPWELRFHFLELWLLQALLLLLLAKHHLPSRCTERPPLSSFSKDSRTWTRPLLPSTPTSQTSIHPRIQEPRPLLLRRPSSELMLLISLGQESRHNCKKFRNAQVPHPRNIFSRNGSHRNICPCIIKYLSVTQKSKRL